MRRFNFFSVCLVLSLICLCVSLGCLFKAWNKAEDIDTAFVAQMEANEKVSEGAWAQPGLVAIAEQITANNAKLAKLVDAKAPSVPYYVDDLGVVHQLKKATGYRIDTYGRLFADVPMDYPFYHLPGGIPEIGSKPNADYDPAPAKHVSAYPLWDMDK